MVVLVPVLIWWHLLTASAREADFGRLALELDANNGEVVRAKRASLVVCQPGRGFFCRNATHYSPCLPIDLENFNIEKLLSQHLPLFYCGEGYCCQDGYASPCTFKCNSDQMGIDGSIALRHLEKNIFSKASRKRDEKNNMFRDFEDYDDLQLSNRRLKTLFFLKHSDNYVDLRVADQYFGWKPSYRSECAVQFPKKDWLPPSKKDKTTTSLETTIATTKTTISSEITSKISTNVTSQPTTTTTRATPIPAIIPLTTTHSTSQSTTQLTTTTHSTSKSTTQLTTTTHSTSKSTTKLTTTKTYTTSKSTSQSTTTKTHTTSKSTTKPTTTTTHTTPKATTKPTTTTTHTTSKSTTKPTTTTTHTTSKSTTKPKPTTTRTTSKSTTKRITSKAKDTSKPTKKLITTTQRPTTRHRPTTKKAKTTKKTTKPTSKRRTTTPKSQRQSLCPSSGLHRHPYDCTRYLVCTNVRGRMKVSQIENCQKRLLFSEKRRKCITKDECNPEDPQGILSDTFKRVISKTSPRLPLKFDLFQ